MIKVSAVIPTYNSVSYIEETVNSLLNQTYPLQEIIVVDDNSSDSTYEILSEIAKRSDLSIRLYKQPKNQGVSAARNRGIKIAQGDWVLLMDSDDIAEHQLVEKECKLIEQLERNLQSNWILAYPAYSQIDVYGKAISGIMRGKQMEPEETFGRQIVRNNIITPSGVMINKDVTIKNGGFREGLKYQIEDWELWLRLAKVGGFAYLDEPLVKVRRHQSNATKNMDKAILAEKEVLQLYEISVIKEEIMKRNLPEIINLSDYISVLYKLDHWEEGYKEIEKVDLKTKNGHLILFLKGLFYLKKDLLENAKTCFAKVIDNDYTHGAALNNLGVIYALSGNITEAENKFNKAIQLFPGYKDAQWNLQALKLQRELKLQDFKFTWRELRPVLLHYYE